MLTRTRIGIVCLLICNSIVPQKGGDAEARLCNMLLSNYTTYSRPVAVEQDPVVVTLGIDLQQIIDIDERDQIITTNAWLKMEWMDVNMRWQPGIFDGVEQIRLPISRIWKPDVLLYNSADQKFDSLWPVNAVVRYDGSVTWIPPAVIRSICLISIDWFPFDDQHCKLKFGSWTYSGYQIDLRNGSVNRGTYVPNGEWRLVDVLVERHAEYYECCPDEPYLDVTFTLWVRRRSLYYTYNFGLPCILISFLALLTFQLPSDSGEKMTLGVTIFMSLCVFLLMVAEIMPQTSDSIPLISSYFTCIMLLVSLSVVFTVIALNCHHHSAEHSMSPMMRRVLLHWMPYVLMMRRPRSVVEDEAVQRKLTPSILHLDKTAPPPNQDCSPLSRFNSTSCCQQPLNRAVGRRMTDLIYLPEKEPTVEFWNDVSRIGQRLEAYQTAHSVCASVASERSSNGEGCGGELSEIVASLRFMTDRQKKRDKVAEVKSDWRFAAAVVDRFCFCCCLAFVLLCTLLILSSAPHLLSD